MAAYRQPPVGDRWMSFDDRPICATCGELCPIGVLWTDERGIHLFHVECAAAVIGLAVGEARSGVRRVVLDAALNVDGEPAPFELVFSPEGDAVVPKIIRDMARADPAFAKGWLPSLGELPAPVWCDRPRFDLLAD